MIRKAISIFIFILLISKIFAQNEHLDSLVYLYESYDQTDSIQISLLNDIAYRYYKIDIAKSEDYATLALQKSINIDHQYGRAKALRIIAISFNLRGDYQKSIALLEEAIKIADEIDNDDLRCKIVNSLGICFKSFRTNNKAINNFKTALEICDSIKDTILLGYINANLGQIHQDEKNYDKAFDYYNEVVRLGLESKNNDLKSIGYEELGEVLIEQRKLQEAESSLYKALDFRNKSLENDISLGSLNGKIAKLKLLTNDLAGSNYHLNQSKKYLEKTGALWLKIDNIAIESDLLLKQRNNKEAINILKEGISIAREIKNLDREALFKDKLASIYSTSKNYKEAFRYKSESKILSDSVNTLSKHQRILDLENKYEIEKKEVALKLLQEQKIKDAQIIKSRSYFTIAAALFAILIGVIALATWLSLKRESKYNSQLELQVDERTLELSQSNKLFQKSNEELERFAYISSHDLKEPLKNINSFTKLIKKESEYADNSKIKEYANILENCSNQLNTMVSDILDYSMVKSDLKIQQVDLNHIIVQLNSDLDNTIKNKNALIVTDDLPTIKTDKSSIYRIFKNLIENGIKYNASNQPIINISTQETNTELKLVFKDNGIGIEDKHHETIFMMFKRLHNKDTYSGSGIGLSTVKAVIEKLKGTIDVKSIPSKGSEFVVTLPKIT